MRRLASLLLLALIVVAGLGAMELAVRWLFPAYDPSGHVKLLAGATPADPVLGPAGQVLRQIKNTGDFDVRVAFNAHGLRDDKDVAEARPDDPIVVGDSFSMGWGVAAADTYAQRLAGLIGKRVYNISIPGDLDQYGNLLDYARRLGARPARVVIGLCMENDLRDYGGVANPAHERPTVRLPRFSKVKDWLMEHSALYFFATTQVHRSAFLRPLAVSAGLIVPNLDAIETVEYSPSVIAATVRRLDDLAQGLDATVLIIPSRALWVGLDQGAEDRVHREIVSSLRARGLRVVDPRQAMESTGDPLSFHFRNDGHWNAKGHDLAARLLAEALRSGP